MATNLALALHRLTRQETALVDGNLSSADVAAHLNASPQAKTIADLTGSFPAVSATALAHVLVRHTLGVDVLLGPPTPERGEFVRTDDWIRALELLVETYAHVVVDTSPFYSEITIKTLDAADVILVPVPLEITSIKNARLFLQVAQKLGYADEKVQLIANRFERADGITPATAEVALGKKFTEVFTSDRRSLVLALNRGVPVVASDDKSRIARDISRLAERISVARVPISGSPPKPQPLAVAPNLVLPIETTSDSSQIRVFIVDDIQDTCDNLAKLIGFESDMKVVGIARDGAEALRIAPAARPDIVLMDICMPVMDGISATEVLTRMPGWKAPIVMMSVQDHPDYKRRALVAGARGYLVKPFSADELIGFIRQVHKLETAMRVLN